MNNDVFRLFLNKFYMRLSHCSALISDQVLQMFKMPAVAITVMIFNAS